MKNLHIFKKIICFITILLSFSSNADQPRPWQMHFQEAATPLMAKIVKLYDFMMIIMSLVVFIVVGLLAYVSYKFYYKRHPVPLKFAHNAKIEVAWTIIPVIILMIVAIPSFKTLYYAERIHKAEMTVKIVGYQWYWHYIYSDHGGFEYDSNLLEEKKLKSTNLRLLEVDNRLVIPVGTTVKFLITGGDVIHSFAVPSFGIKTDAVPGRTNETWVKVKKPGVYYGQCSELCGVHHGFMPIAIEVVTKEQFAEWVKIAQEKYK